MTVRAILALASAALAAACAPSMSESDTPASTDIAGGGRQCFYANPVRNFRADGVATVYLRANDNTVYRIDGAGGCRDVDFTSSLAITSDLPSAAGSRLCVGDSARLSVPSAGSAGTCRVRVSKALSEAEVAALPSTNRP